MSKSKLLLFLFLWGVCVSHAQVEEAWVYFKDKQQVSAYLDNPLQMLSQRALDRRVNQSIPLDSVDIPISIAYISQLQSSPGIEILAKSKWLNAVHVRGDLNELLELETLSFVKSLDFLSNTVGQKEVLPKSFTKSDKLDLLEEPTYGNASNQIEMIGLNSLHREGFLGEGMVIAVMDAGFPGVDSFSAFDSLRNNKQILGGYNFVERNSNIYARHSHGTSVLSTMGAYVSDTLIGAAPKSNYYLFITEDNTQEHPLEESLWVEAAEMADSLGVDIINTSLGYSYFDNSNYDYTYRDLDGKTTFITRGAEIAASRGMIVVNSAGNAGDDLWKYVTAPADAASVLTVGAVDMNRQIASFSSIGPTSDGRIKPDVMAQGRGVAVIRGDGVLGFSSGTSFASPIMAGAIACLWQAYPNKTNQDILEMVKQSSSEYDSPDVYYGYGIPDFDVYAEELDYEEPVERWSLYPNPSSGPIYIELPKDELPKTLKVFSIFGAQLFQHEITEERTELDFEHLKTGVYIFQLGSISSLKIIKY